jgi:hypothetical protein
MYAILKQRKTYIYLVLSAISMIAAMIVSIPDNLPGILLAFFSSVLFILAFTHNWAKSKPYVILLVFSLVGFVVSVVLHNVFEVMGKGTFLELIGVFFFILAIFLCPAGIIIGGIGSLIKLYKIGDN